MRRDGNGEADTNCSNDACLFVGACAIARKGDGRQINRYHLDAGKSIEVDEAPSMVFFVERGFVCIEDLNEEGEANYLSFNGKGEAINLLQVFAAARSSYRMTALVDTCICQISFSSSLEQEEVSDLMLETVDNLSVSVESLISCIWMLYGRSVGERIKRLLSIASRFCDPDDSGLVSLTLGQSGLARAVRAERASVAKELKALEKEGVLRVGYGTIAFDPSRVPENPIGS